MSHVIYAITQKLWEYVFLTNSRDDQKTGWSTKNRQWQRKRDTWAYWPYVNWWKAWHAHRKMTCEIHSMEAQADLVTLYWRQKIVRRYQDLTSCVRNVWTGLNARMCYQEGHVMCSRTTCCPKNTSSPSGHGVKITSQPFKVMSCRLENMCYVCHLGNAPKIKDPHWEGVV